MKIDLDDIVSKDKVFGFEASARNSIANRKHLDEEFELKLKKINRRKGYETDSSAMVIRYNG